MTQLDSAAPPSAAQLHTEALVIEGSTVIELSREHIDRARQGGVTAVNHTVSRPYADTLTALHEINECRRWIDANAEHVMLATTVEDIREAKRTGREAVIFGPQDTEMIGVDLDLLGTFYDLGVRILQLTYQRQNLLGCGCGERVDGGLTNQGRTFVAAMNELGILVDVSHCGERTGLEAMESSERAVVVTHSFCDVLSPHIRAKSDGFIKQLGQQGGVIGITSLSAFLYHPDNPDKRPTLDRWIEHVQRVVELAGIDAVAIATDYDETLTEVMRDEERSGKPEIAAIMGEWPWPQRRAVGMDDAADFPNFTTALLDSGFSEQDVAKVLGENWLRVFQESWTERDASTPAREN